MRASAFFLAFAASLPAWADEVVLRNGAVFSGVVREEGDRIVIEVDVGSMTFRRVDVREVRRTDDPLKEFEQKRRAATDVRAYYELALWARDKGLGTKAGDLLRRVILLEPDHEGARKALGYERVEGKWLQGDELMVAKGFVRHEGRWLRRETAERFREHDLVLRVEEERRAGAERLAEIQRQVEMARLAVERERIQLERERASRYDGDSWLPGPWLWRPPAVVVVAPPCPPSSPVISKQEPSKCSRCGSCACACAGLAPPVVRGGLGVLPTRLPPPPPLPAPMTPPAIRIVRQ